MASIGESLRSRRPPSSHELEEAMYKRRYIELFRDQEHGLSVLCSDFSAALATEIEEVQTYHSHFKSGLRRAFGQILRRSLASKQPVVIFHEAIPGYNLMLFKKGTPLESGQDPAHASDQIVARDDIPGNGSAKDVSNGRRRRPSRSQTPQAPSISDFSLSDAEEHSIEWQAVSKIIDCYFQRTGNRVLAIEAEDALLSFFPVSDMKRNLREMGYVGFKDD